MAKKQNKSAITSEEPAEDEQEVLTKVKVKKQTKQEKKQAKEEKQKAQKKAKAKAKNEKPKRHRIKEIFSELKKVNWPSFKQTCKQTGTVLVVVVVFMLVVLGFDSLLSWLMSLVV